jgi:UDPglucose 6-dehydrogenase
LKNKRVAILGAAFKPDSDDVRDSPALDIAAQIQEAGAVVTVHDPKAIKNAQKRFPALRFEEKINQTLADSNIVLHLTEWKIYRDINPSEVKSLVKDCIIIDGRNALDRELWIKAGWKFRALGRTHV